MAAWAWAATAIGFGHSLATCPVGPSFSTEQAKAVIHAALTLLQGQLAILSQFPSQVQARFQILWGLALGRGLGVSSTFQVTLRVNLTCWVSLAHNFSLPLPVVVIDGLYKVMEIQQHDGLAMVHHLIFDAVGQSFVGLPKKGMVIPLYAGC